MKNPKTILIAGCGYVGSRLARMLDSRGQPYLAISLSGNSAEPLPSEVARCDISDPDALAGLAQNISPPAAIVHCASSNRGGPDAYRAVYLRGAKNLLSTFPGRPLFFTSSTSVYSQTDGSLVDESSPAEPGRETSRILRQAEELVLAGGGTVLRLSGIYGPGRCIYLQRLRDGSATIESGPVSRFLNQIHRDDAAAAIMHLMQLDSDPVRGQIYNVSDNHSPTQRECYQTLSAFLGQPLPPEGPAPENPKRARSHRRISNKKLTASGWHPTYPTLLDALENDAELIPSFQNQSNSTTV